MDNKALLALGALLGGAIWLAMRNGAEGSEPPDGSSPGSNQLSLTIIPAGTRVGRSIIAGIPVLAQGSSGNIAQVKLTNTTVYAGTTTPAPYTFVLRLVIAASPETLLNVTEEVSMAAGEANKVISKAFNVPFTAGLNYAGSLWLMNTANSVELARAPLVTGTITGAQVTPGGTISW